MCVCVCVFGLLSSSVPTACDFVQGLKKLKCRNPCIYFPNCDDDVIRELKYKKKKWKGETAVTADREIMVESFRPQNVVVLTNPFWS